jgi:hypothetical protein
LDGFKRYNHGNVAVQAASLRLLADGDAFPFTWILPGHGRMVRTSLVLVHYLFSLYSVFTIMCVAHGTTWQARFGSVAEKDAAVRAAAAAFEREDAADGLFAVGYY